MNFNLNLVIQRAIRKLYFFGKEVALQDLSSSCTIFLFNMPPYILFYFINTWLQPKGKRTFRELDNAPLERSNSHF